MFLNYLILSLYLIISNQSPATNIIAKPETSTNDQHLSYSLAIQPCAPAKTNVPSPPTLFLDSTILANVCENMFLLLTQLLLMNFCVLLKSFYASDHIMFYTYLFLKNFSLFFSSLLFVFILYFLLMTKRGVDV